MRPGPYRHLWEQHVVRARRGNINQLAVAEVLARHLAGNPRRPADEHARPMQLKDTVSRVLSARLLSRSTLRLFIDAFGIAEDDADRLWQLWEGIRAPGVLAGERAVATATEENVRSALGPRRHQTLSLHDHVHVGPDRLLARARTLQVVEATSDGVDRIPYLYDIGSLALETGQGCQGTSAQLTQLGDGSMYVTEILLAAVLGKGETATLEYWTTYLRTLEADSCQPQERQYRRGVIGRLENLDLRVEFHCEALPAAVWWASWDGIDGDVVQQEQVTLDSQHSVHRFLRSIERTVAGFHWTW
jgi:hypothetical protein